MPTENRSSNTEMVSVPEGFMLVERNVWTEQQVEAATACITRLKGVPGMRDCDLAMAAIDAAQCKAPDIALSDLLPAQQPHPDPIAWMVGTAFWWTKEEAERDAAATGLPIVGLGPMTCITPAERQLGEPVCLDGATFMGEPNFQDSIEWYREGISKHWKKICDLRAQVERLRAALRFYADREHFHFESGNWDTVSGEPLNILWCGEEPDFIEDGTVARNALSASAEPKCGRCHGRGLLRIATVCGPADKVCPDCASAEPSAPVEIDERA